MPISDSALVRSTSAGSYARGAMILGIVLAVCGCGGTSSEDGGLPAAPTVSITAPANGATFAASDIITLRAAASDGAGGDLSAIVTWSSSIAGTLGGGSPLSTSLAAGTHTVTVKATNGAGIESTAAVTVVVDGGTPPSPNSAPTVSITAPANGATYAAGQVVTLRATANDTEDGNLSARVAWSSSVSGALGTGATLGANLAAGTHIVTARVTDNGGLTSSAALTVVVSIGMPLAHAGADRTVEAGTAVTLNGAASNDPGGSITAYQWSQTAGPAVALATPAAVSTSFTASSVTASTLLGFQLRVTDNSGLSSTDSVNVTVDPAALPVLAFSDITSSAGIGGPSTFGGHGAMFGDVNGDGLPDLYVTVNQSGAPLPDLFYLNLGAGVFREEGLLRGIDNLDSGSHGGVWADFDRDGDLDLFNGSFEQNRLYRNGGSGTFADATLAAGLPARAWATRGSLAFDMDGDGDLDIFAVNGFLGNDDPGDERNEVYRNDGNFQFTSIDSGALVTALVGQGATAVDFDNDGDIDLFGANRTGPVAVLRNDGSGSFTQLNASSLGLQPEGRDGLTFADVNDDGFLDVLLSQVLYLHNGVSGYVRQRAFDTGSYHYMGGFADLDNDGDFDLVFPGANRVYLNDGAGNFNASATFALGTIDDPRSVAFADIDQDGDLDFFYAQKFAANRLIENRLDGGNRWLKLDLRGTGGQRAPHGARVHLYEAGGLGDTSRRITWWELRSQDGYLSQTDPVVHLGVGARTHVDVRAVFSGGGTVDLPNTPTNAWVEVRRP